MSNPSSDRNDELLSLFLQAPQSAEEAVLEALLECIEPLLCSTLRRKAVSSGSPSDLEEELMAAIRLRILEQLRRSKNSYVEGDSARVIHHFTSLCRTIANNTINEYLRLKYPERSSLQNQLQYVIQEAKDNNTQPLFALWRDVEERVCGFSAWEGRKLVLTTLHHLLASDPQLALQKSVPGGDARKQSLGLLLDSLLKWLGSPAAFDAVVQAMLQWRKIEEPSEVDLFQPLAEDEFAAFKIVSPDLSPENHLVLHEYLRQLWHDISDLPPQHCAALLLNLCDAQGRGVLGFLPVLGIATFAQITRAMDMELHQFEALWPKLPLDDREIAALYGCRASSVSVWRSRARIRLLKKQGDEAEEV